MNVPEPVIRKRDENLLFLRQLMKNPKSLGALFPSSNMLANFITSHVDLVADYLIVEIGAGTGRFTQALLRAGVTPDKLVIVELDPAMCVFLRKNFPNVMVVEGDAKDLKNLLPAQIVGSVTTIISGIPMINLSADEQIGVAEACFSILSETGSLLQFTYGPMSPLSSKKLGLRKKRLGHIFLNIPPAVVWRYWRQSPLSASPLVLKKVNKITRFKNMMSLKKRKGQPKIEDCA